LTKASTTYTAAITQQQRQQLTPCASTCSAAACCSGETFSSAITLLGICLTSDCNVFSLCAAVNKQLNDKERVAAALENSHLIGVVNKCIAESDP
jgi:hypothetical protein